MSHYNPCESLVRDHERWIERIQYDWLHEALERAIEGEQYDLILKKRLRYAVHCLEEAKKWKRDAERKSQITRALKQELVATAFHPNRIFGWDMDTFDMMVGD